MKLSLMKTFSLCIIAISLLFPAAGCGSGAPSGKEIQAATFKNLDAMRTRKKKLVLEQLEGLRRKAEKADEDATLMEVFREFHQGGVSRTAPDGRRGLVDKMDKRYVTGYGDFYDILFIRKDGLVFYSVKLESDYLQNLFDGPLSETKLARRLKDNPRTQFIDYDYYSPSREPASFFVKEIARDGKSLGWIVFQFSLNAVNSILTGRGDDKNFGRTGEVYLANESKAMLTESRFMFRDRAMRRKVDTEAIKLALKKERGDLVTEDYRGVRVFSSAEKFYFAGSAWIILAEIDEDEVVTEMFTNHRGYYMRKLLERLEAGGETRPRQAPLEEKTVEVDINDYARGTASETLVTGGVTTCTGVVVAYPGKFAYLGHLYPLDETYYSRVERFFVNAFFSVTGGASNRGVVDLLGEIVRDVKQYDVYPSETRNLKVLAAATHKDSFKGIMEKLLAEGLFLSQIKIAFDPGMERFNIITGVDDGLSYMEWVSKDGAKIKWTSVEGITDVGSIVKAISGMIT